MPFPDEDIDFKAAEVKFQISFMFPVVHNIFKDNGSLYVAYTNRSFWQLFNEDDLSSPFRETNHEPEIWLQFDTDYKVLGLTNRLMTFGFSPPVQRPQRPHLTELEPALCQLHLRKGQLRIRDQALDHCR